MDKPDMKWVTIEKPYMGRKMSWPLWDYLWLEDADGSIWLSKDRGNSFSKTNRLRFFFEYKIYIKILRLIRRV